MAATRFRCRFGLHSYVPEHPRDERLRGPDGNGGVCRWCGKHRRPSGIPMAILGG